jgi:hypothetical protein
VLLLSGAAFSVYIDRKGNERVVGEGGDIREVPFGYIHQDSSDGYVRK